MSEDTVTIEVPKPLHTLFNAKRNGLPEVLVVNRALLSLQHAEIFAW